MQGNGQRTTSDRSSPLIDVGEVPTSEDCQSPVPDALLNLPRDLAGQKAAFESIMSNMVENGPAALLALLKVSQVPGGQDVAEASAHSTEPVSEPPRVTDGSESPSGDDGQGDEPFRPFLHARLVDICIAEIDRLVCAQVNAILHHPDFQRLEASWRGLLRLVDAGESARNSLENDSSRGGLVIRVLNVSKRELLKDARRAIEFDQSVLFHKVYEEEFGIAGGHPYGLLIGDYAFSNTPDDLELLGSLGGVAGALFAPFVAGAAPALLSIDNFSALEQPLDFSAAFLRPDFIKWRAFRASSIRGMWL